MSMSVEQVTAEALSLPRDARAMLVDRLVESLNPAQDGLMHEVWTAPALRRRDEVRNGQVQTIPGDEAIARVRRAVAHDI